MDHDVKSNIGGSKMSFEKKDLLEIAQTLIDQKFHDQADKLLFDISQNFGIDPIHLGVVMVFNIMN